MSPATPSASPTEASAPADDSAQRILAVAGEIFARDGYRQTDVQRIADAAGIGKGSVYRRFPSKRELFLAAVDHGMQRLRAEVDSAADPSADPLDQIAAAVRAYLAFFDANPHLVELLIQERAEFRERKEPTYFAHRRTNLARWRELYRRLMQEGRIREVPIERITDVMSNAVYGTMFTNFFAGHERSYEEQAADILDVVLHGVGCAPRAEEER